MLLAILWFRIDPNRTRATLTFAKRPHVGQNRGHRDRDQKGRGRCTLGPTAQNFVLLLRKRDPRTVPARARVATHPLAARKPRRYTRPSGMSASRSACRMLRPGYNACKNRRHTFLPYIR